MGKSALESLGVRHYDCPSDAFRGRRISFDKSLTETYPISWGQLTVSHYSFQSTTSFSRMETHTFVSIYTCARFQQTYTHVILILRFVVRTRKRGRTPYVRRSKRNRLLWLPTIAPPQPTDEQFSEISYSPTLETQPLALTSPLSILLFGKS